MPPTMQIKRGSAAALAAVNPTPLVGELVWDSTNNTLRVGNGSTAYSSLAIVSATPSSHSHGNITNAGAIGSTANLPIITTTSGVLTTGTFSTTAGTFCEGNDSRLSDTRTPTDGSVTTAKIANDAVTYAKLQNVSATDRLLGRSSAGSGDVEEITCTAFGRSLIDDADAAAARTTLSVQPTASPAFTGRVGIGAAANAIAYVHIDQTAPSSGGVTQVIRNTVTIPSSTTDYWTFLSAPTTQAASFTLSGMRHFVVDPQALGAGSTVTNQFGYIVESSMTGATNNYGFYSNIASGTGRWNFYSNGTAPSYFGGQLLVTTGSASACGVAFSGDTNTGLAQIGGADTASLVTAGVERVRVDAGGNVLINTTSADPGGTNASSGICLAPSSYISVSRSDGASLILNRKTTDGILAAFYQEGVLEGNISVAGNTISYNAFCGSHWAQLIDGSRPAILRGTVLETIDEMCEWPGEPKNDRLPRVKVSDTPRSRRVYGVFMAWDDEYAATGDMYATALGAYMVRVSGTVQAGDLLESAGDGTARTQSDDIVRSSTIGKVSSTHQVAEYDDGSYLVPCVLMCG